MVRWAVASSVAASMEFGEGTDTDVLAQVDVAGDGSCSLDTCEIISTLKNVRVCLVCLKRRCDAHLSERSTSRGQPVAAP